LVGALGCGKVRPQQQSLEELTQELHHPSPEIRSHAVCMLGNYGKEAVPVLIDGLKDRDQGIRSYVALTLSGLGEPAVPALIEALKDSNRETKKAALFALSMGDAKARREAVPGLLKLTRNRDAALAADALTLLEQIDPATAERVHARPAPVPPAAR
jgi:HEAT repeat protein